MSSRSRNMVRMAMTKKTHISMDSSSENMDTFDFLGISDGTVQPVFSSTPIINEENKTWAVLGESTFENNVTNNSSNLNISKILESTDNFPIEKECEISDPFSVSGSEYCPSSSVISSEASGVSVEHNDKPYKSQTLVPKSSKKSGKKRNKASKKLHNVENHLTRSSTKILQDFPIDHDEPCTSQSLLPRSIDENNKDTIGEFNKQQDIENLHSSDSDIGIQITHSKKSTSSCKRFRDKRYCCLICQKIVVNLPRHLTSIHSSDISVAKILALPVNSRKRRIEFAKISREGNFYHNCEILQAKHGELILLRRPTLTEKQKYSYIDYGPCPDCLGFMLKSNISAHIKMHCNVGKNMNEIRKPISESNSLLAGIFGYEMSAKFTDNIILKMRTDEITKVCREDDLIVKVGAMMFEKYHTTQAELIRQTMRQLGRLLLEIKKRSGHITNLKEALKPVNFDTIVQAVKELCSTSASKTCRPQFGIPSLALKLGHSLRKCANIERGNALKNGNRKTNIEMESFLSLMEIEWNTRISFNALNTLYQRKINCTQLLPITSDLIKLNNYLRTEIENYVADIQKTMQPIPSTWFSLASLVLCRVVVFNKRRSGETARMTLHHYSIRPLWTEQTTQELKQSLTNFERELAEKMCMVEIPGKRGKKVPVLLTPDTKEAIDLLIKTRTVAGISKDNPYVFARSGANLEYLRGHDCLRKCLSELDLTAPENITGTKLRKYVATVTQIINLSENETDWLARHLGHDIRVHREYYRLHESAVELTKISRLLLAVDSGETNQFAGKKLNEIQLTDLPQLAEDEMVDNKNEEEAAEIIEEMNSKSSKLSKTADTHSLTKKNKRKTQVKKPWNEEEKSLVLDFFKTSIRKGNIPGKAECEKCISENPSLSHRKWTDLKFCIKITSQK